MKSILFLRKHWWKASVVFILFLATFFRFVNYENRWGLAYDQAHDALVARHAIDSKEIPLVGPFSSGAPVQTGGHWYWFIMFATAFYPKSVMTPWIVLTLLHVVLVLSFIYFGKFLVEKKFGLLLGLLVTVSTAQITQATNLTLTAPMAFISLGILWSAVLYIRGRKALQIGVFGFFAGLAPATHLSGVALLIMVLGIIIKTKPSLKHILILVVGIVIPFIPNILFDLQNDFVHFNGVMLYILHDQYRTSFEVLGRRWLTYMGIFWPNGWAHIIGGFFQTGFFFFFTSIIIILYRTIILRKKGEIEFLGVIFIGAVILLRYTRTPLFDSYLVFLHPFVFVLSAWIVYVIWKVNKFIGIGLLVIILTGSVYKNVLNIRAVDNFNSEETIRYMNTLIKKYPKDKFSLYSYQYRWVDRNFALVLYLHANGKIDDNGRKVGVVIATREAEFKRPILYGEKLGYQVLDLDSSTSAQLDQAGWAFINPSMIYRSTERWHK